MHKGLTKYWVDFKMHYGSTCSFNIHFVKRDTLQHALMYPDVSPLTCRVVSLQLPLLRCTFLGIHKWPTKVHSHHAPPPKRYFPKYTFAVCIYPSIVSPHFLQERIYIPVCSKNNSIECSSADSHTHGISEVHPSSADSHTLNAEYQR